MVKVEQEDKGDWLSLMKDVGVGLDNQLPSQMGLFMKLTPRPQPYKVRLVAVPKVTRRHWEVFKPERHYPVSPAIHVSLKEADVAWSLGGWKPGARFTTVVMDRESDRPMILEFNRTIFVGFTDFMKATGIDPSGPKAPDFLIRVDGSGGGQYPRGYSVTPTTDPCPLTDQEMAKAANALKMAATKTKTAKPEEIRDMWMALPPERKYHPLAMEAAKERNGYGLTSREGVLAYIKEYGRNIYVLVLDHGKVIPAPIADMDPAWAAAYSSYYADFGIRPNRYLSEDQQADEIASQMLEDTDDLETKWIDPNSL